MSGAFEILANLLKARSGLMLTADKGYLLETRLAPMMRRESLPDLRALAARVASMPGSAFEAEIVETMTTGETLFFRDDKPFVHFREVALPKLALSRPAGVPLRIWSAASSSGQEAYSLAMILADEPGGFARRPARILGTDLSREKVERAKEGVYSQFEVQRGLSQPMLDRHFVREGSGFRISAALRAVVEFRTFNLLDNLAPLGIFDVVFCRNVLIYFDAPTKSRVLEAISKRMAPDGLLYLGGAETVIGLTERFVLEPGTRGVYRLA